MARDRDADIARAAGTVWFSTSRRVATTHVNSGIGCQLDAFVNERIVDAFVVDDRVKSRMSRYQGRQGSGTNELLIHELSWIGTPLPACLHQLSEMVGGFAGCPQIVRDRRACSRRG